jgi:hypothetical protein
MPFEPSKPHPTPVPDPKPKQAIRPTMPKHQTPAGIRRQKAVETSGGIGQANPPGKLPDGRRARPGRQEFENYTLSAVTHDFRSRNGGNIPGTHVPNPQQNLAPSHVPGKSHIRSRSPFSFPNLAHASPAETCATWQKLAPRPERGIATFSARPTAI